MARKAEAEMDIRILTLMRWNLPQTGSIQRILQDRGAPDMKGRYVSFQNYHFVEVEECIPSERTDYDQGGAQAFAAAHRVLSDRRNQAASADIYRQQSLTLLGRSSAFWEKEPQLLFITLIQFQGEAVPKLNEIERRITAANPKAEEKAALYHSVDYCDMVLFAKDMTYTAYQDLLWTLVFDKQAGIRDTITTFCISQKYLKAQFKKMEQTGDFNAFLSKYRSPWGKKQQISLSIDVSIQDSALGVDAWNGLKEQLEKISSPVEIHRISGRHDMRIRLTDVTLGQMLYAIWSLDTACGGGGLGGYELLVLSPDWSPVGGELSERDNGQPQETLDIRQRAVNRIQDCRRQYMETAGEQVHMPSEEIYRSLQALAKSGFADEFVLSVLPSLVEYTGIYQTYAAALRTPEIYWEENELRKYQERKQRDALEELQREYFQAVSMLVQCTMHGERQFVQAPSFNYTAFDIPPKLLALYSAAAYYVAEALNDSPERSFSFLITPDFREDIHVRPLSRSVGAREKSISHPHKLMLIRLEERFFYEPTKLLYQLCHEIAHHVGGQTRCREARARSVFRSIAMYVICMALPLIREEDPPKELLEVLASAMGDVLLMYYETGRDHGGQQYYNTDLASFLKEEENVRMLVRTTARKEVLQERIVGALADLRAEDSLQLLANLQDDTLGTSYVEALFDRPETRGAALETIAAGIVQRLSTEVTDWYYGRNIRMKISFSNLCDAILQAHSEAYADFRMYELLRPTGIGSYDMMAEDYLNDGLDVQRSMRYAAVARAIDTGDGKNIGSRFRYFQECIGESDVEDDDLKMQYIIRYAQEQICDYLKGCPTEKLKNPETASFLNRFVSGVRETDPQKVFSAIHELTAKYRDKLFPKEK